MRLYFAADNQAPENQQKIFAGIIDILHHAGVVVMSNLIQKNVSAFSSQDLEKMAQTGESMIEQVDGIIVEASRPLADAGYLVAAGLAHKKPILYLTIPGKEPNQNLLHVKKDPATGKLLELATYSPPTLKKILIDFIGLVERASGIEKPSIKFTLRITHRIERYLQWKTNNTNLSKADYLRAMIEGLINKDKDYEAFVRDKDR